MSTPTYSLTHGNNKNLIRGFRGGSTSAAKMNAKTGVVDDNMFVVENGKRISAQELMNSANEAVAFFFRKRGKKGV
jgi:hypothetical protein